jgi:4-hydroxy-tetrahydrodipicolinate reductase
MNIIIYGAGGVMGHKLKDKLEQNEKNNILALVDPMNDSYVQSLKEVDESADILIDFSHPANLEDILNYSTKKEVPTLLCTTGYSIYQVEKIEEAGNSIPILLAGNTSIGIAVLKVLLKTALEQLPNWDVELVESHHNRKVDSPSGTAKELVSVVEKEKEKINAIYGRNPDSGKREKEDVGIHSIRGGSIVGEHKVIFAGENELIEIKHSAISRDLFVSGAIRLAEFLASQKSGLYKVEDAYK